MSITANEDLGRRVSSNTSREYAVRNGTIPWKELLPKKEETRFSVDRLSIGSTTDIAEIAVRDRNAANKANSEDYAFYGWGVVNRGSISENGRKVEAYAIECPPERANPYHADVILPTRDRELQKDHAKQMAAVSSWLDNPLLED